MKTLLIAHGKNTIPLGLVDIYLYLKKRDYYIDIIHLHNNYDKLKRVDDTPDIVGITTNTIMSTDTAALIPIIRNKWPKCKIVLGGKHFSSDVMDYEKDRLIKMADYIVFGDGEYAMEDIINDKITNKIIAGKPISSKDYKDLGLPNESLMRKAMIVAPDRMLFSRGCPFNCLFCCERRVPIIRMDPDKAMQHMRNIYQWFGISYIEIDDDVFAVEKNWMNNFKEEYLKQNIKFRIKCFIHGKMFDEERYDTLLQSGVSLFCLGAESGDNDILKLIHKNCTVDDYIKINNMFRKKNKGRLHTLWMIGNIGETSTTMNKTVSLCKTIGDPKPWFSYAIPFPGTGFWKIAKQYGKIIENDFNKWCNKNPVFIPFGTTSDEMKYWYRRGIS